MDVPRSICEPDQTFEIIMTKLDQNIMNIFTKKCSISAEDASQVCLIFEFP
jgi:hypothetical protein